MLVEGDGSGDLTTWGRLWMLIVLVLVVSSCQLFILVEEEEAGELVE